MSRYKKWLLSAGACYDVYNNSLSPSVGIGYLFNDGRKRRKVELANRIAINKSEALGPDDAIAMLVGNSIYKNMESLREIPYHDIALIKERFDSVGIQSEVCKDIETLTEFNKTLNALFNKMDSVNKSVVIVYYSGHSFTKNGEVYLAMTEADDIKEINSSNCFNINAFESQFTEDNRLRDKILILLVDGCREVAGVPVNKNYRKELRLPNGVIIYATSHNTNVKFKERDYYSLFAREFAQLITESDLTISELIIKLRRKVFFLSNKKQLIEEGNVLFKQEFYFNPK